MLNVVNPIGGASPIGRPEPVAPASANGQTAEVETPSAVEETKSAAPGRELSKEEQAVVNQLRERDREVRAHEQAHARVGGQYAGAPSYEYQTGPDGKRYAVGGSVSIDVSPISGDPEATIEKMRVVKAAALAPAEPSAQDRRVAAVADQQSMEAQAELIQLRADERRGDGVEEPSPTERLQAAVDGYGAAAEAAGPLLGQSEPTYSNAA